jgi:hypothetical protein
VLVSIHWEKRWLVVLDLFDWSKVSSDELKMTTLVKGIERYRRSSADTKSRRNRYLDRPSQDIPLQQGHYRELYYHRCLLLDAFRHRENLLPMKAPSSAVQSAHHHCAESLALYLSGCSLDNGIRWPWLCTSSSLAAYYHNAPSLSHKKYKIETEWYYQLFETDSSIHVSSAWTLKHHTVSTDSASRSNIWWKYNSPLSNGLLHCLHRRTDCTSASYISN